MLPFIKDKIQFVILLAGCMILGTHVIPVDDLPEEERDDWKE